MVEIDKKYPSQQNAVRRGFSKFLGLISFVAFVIQVLVFAYLCKSIDCGLAGTKIEFFKTLFSTHLVALLTIIALNIGCDIFAFFARKVNNSRILVTYTLGLNNIIVITMIITALVFAF